MKITWMGHACFVLESGGYRLMLDPYCDVPGLEDISGQVNEVLCSHEHDDHNYTDELTLAPAVSPFTCQDISSFHDEQQGALRGHNTIRCLSVEGLRVVHLGDLGHLLSEEQIKPLSGCDVLFIPVGGTYTLDSKQAHQVMEQIKPRITIPMHYLNGKRGYPVLEPADNFLGHCDSSLIRHYDGPSLTVTADTPAQIAVLSL